MAEDLIFTFGADITQFKGNIQQVIDQIKKVQGEIKTAAAGDLPKLNAQLFELTENLKRLKTVGTPVAEGFKKVQDGASGARIALTNVSQIAQDLPFGFIGIQNNIPGLVQSFTKLSSESGGVVGALKAMFSALKGPAGIFLGFSLVTSGITFLISKFGSLGAGLEAIFGKTNLAAKAQEDYNKTLIQATASTATEVAEIKILVGVLTDLSQPLKDRQAAYVELKKIRPDIVAGQELENISTREATILINENATAVLNLIKLKAKETAISSILNKNAEELLKLEKEEIDLKARSRKAQDFLNESRNEGTAFTDNAAGLLKILGNEIKENKLQQDALNKVADDYLKILDPTIKGIAAVDLQTQQLTDAQNKAAKAAAKAKKDAEDKAKWDKIDAENLALIEKYTPKKQFPLIGAIQLTKEGVDFGKLMTKDQPIELFDIKSFQQSYDTFIQGIFDKTDFLKAVLADKIKNLNLPVPNLPKLTALGQAFIDSGLSLEDFERKLEDTFNRTYNFVKDLLISPLETLFDDVLTKGETSWQKFGQTILDVLNKLIVKLAAAVVVAGILAVLTGGATTSTGSAVSGAANAGSFSKILGSLLGFNKASNPSFGGIQGGGVGMSGSVNLTLRGTDLVGAINRTNSQISRVG